MTNPKWYGLLCAELDEFFQDRDFNAQLRALDKCVLLNAVIQESLRLSTPIPPPPRVVPPDGIEINSHFVPGGTSVGVPLWTHHLDPDYFPDPNLFDPGRWIENSAFEGRNTLFAFIAGKQSLIISVNATYVVQDHSIVWAPSWRMRYSESSLPW
jgi:cytochrome P450